MSIRHIAAAGNLILAFGGALAAAHGAAAGSLETLYSFCSKGGANCTDGGFPGAGLFMDKPGNLFGTTQSGGAPISVGTVFELTPNGTKPKRTAKILHVFCTEGTDHCPDGGLSTSDLISDDSGNLYGTAWGGGIYALGTVFKLTADAAGTGTYTVIYSFGARPHDAANPAAALIIDGAGNLYGTTQFGLNYSGAVFELTPNATKTKWREKILHRFCPDGGNICPDGGYPTSSLMMDPSGNLYGTTAFGGIISASDSEGAGTVFKLTPGAAGTSWSTTVLHKFDPDHGDGRHPFTDLVMDGSGNLYGTTVSGGADSGGTVFELTPGANGKKPAETILYDFCAEGGTNCTDGKNPFASLITDAAGKLYGTTQHGGINADASGNGGTVFEMTPNATRTIWTHKVLHSFCSKGAGACTDGSLPQADLIVDMSGNLYGTTAGGGAHNSGTAFKLKR